MESRKLSVALFAGGRGTSSICASLTQDPNVELTVLVNAYDDGLSTGRLRRFIPGMLGPSDIRKNISRLVNEGEPSGRAIRAFLEYRFPVGIRGEDALRTLESVAKGESASLPVELHSSFHALESGQVLKMTGYIGTFLDYFFAQSKQGVAFDFGDCSFGNLIFSGSYLTKRDFNIAIRLMEELCVPRGRILNLTRGENLVLVGVGADGSLLRDEASIASPQGDTPISEIFLLDNYLSAEDERKLSGKSCSEIASALARYSRNPEINPEAAHVLKEADLIIYGPGTLHSSLLPSYLTDGLSELIAGNSKAEKVFIANVRKDREISHESASSITQKLLFYLNRKGQRAFSAADLVSSCLFQRSKGNENYLEVDASSLPIPESRIRVEDWEVESGFHDGERVWSALISMLNCRGFSLNRKLSIIIPAYNEERFIDELLKKVISVPIGDYRFSKEILVVDDGSTDKTAEIAGRHLEVKVIRLGKNQGKGFAVRRGISESTGQYILIQDGDLEYDPNDYLPMLKTLNESIASSASTGKNQTAVYGSRTLPRINAKAFPLLGRHPKQGVLQWVASILISTWTMLLFRRLITDTLTAYKLYPAEVIRNLKLKTDGFETDHEITAKLIKSGVRILEVPIQYSPRTVQEGKKIGAKDGFIAIWTLLRFRFSD